MHNNNLKIEKPNHLYFSLIAHPTNSLYILVYTQILEEEEEERKKRKNSLGDAMGYDAPEGVDIRGRYDEEFATILSKQAMQFVADLQRELKTDIEHAMDCRKEAQMRYNNGELPKFDPATKHVRDGEWVCAAVPPAVADRRVEITGPVDRKMVINALNSGAKVFMVAVTYF